MDEPAGKQMDEVNATIEGLRLLEEVEGVGEASDWLTMCIANGGVVCATPWLLFMGFPKTGEESTLYVSYLYGTARSVADFSKLILDTGRFTPVEFRKNFLKTGDSAEKPCRFDGRFVEKLWRLTR